MTEPQSRQAPIAEAMRPAIKHHQAGRLDQAELVHRALLASDPDHAGAKTNLGLVALQSGRAGEALPPLKAALDANASNRANWLNCAAALAASGDALSACELLHEAQGRGHGGPELRDALAIVERLVAARAVGDDIFTADVAALTRLHRERRFDELEDLAAQLCTKFPRSARIRAWIGPPRLAVPQEASLL